MSRSIRTAFLAVALVGVVAAAWVGVPALAAGSSPKPPVVVTGVLASRSLGTTSQRVALLKLKPGKWTVLSTMDVHSGGAQNSSANCTLLVGAGTTTGASDNGTTNVGNSTFDETLALNASGVVKSGGARLLCTGNGGGASLLHVRMTAVKAGTLRIESL